MKVLRGYSWPGNVRELENVVHSLTLTHEGSLIGIESVPEFILWKRAKSRRVTVTRDMLRRTLVEEGWNVTRAAVRIGVSREYVHALTRRHGLARPAKNHSQSDVRQGHATSV
jgi:transcriptional regulator of acetoin/glycerol metabolism